MSTGPLRLSELLGRPEAREDQRHVVRAYRRGVALPLALVGALVTVWCAWAPLSGAVVAQGRVRAEFDRKTVQHQEGGIVQRIFVHNGARVREGEPLMVVGDVRSDAELGTLRHQLAGELIRAARAQAELRFAERFDGDVDASPDSAYDRASDATSRDFVDRERRLFDARRRALVEHIDSMHAQIGEAERRVASLAMQIEATSRSEKLAREELGINAQLAERGFVQKTRLITLQRSASDYLGQLGEARANAAEARGQIGALRASIAQARGQYLQRAADELREAGARVSELEERLRAAKDQVARQTVRAPVDGEVLALRVGAPGVAVGPREPLLEIAPSGENLVVETRIEPNDIDDVRAGGAADVRLTAFDVRSTPLLAARVVFVSADAVADENDTRRRHFVAHVEVQAAELARHPQLRLRAGMPAEVYVTTTQRSLFAYLAKPLGLFADRAMRER